MAAFFFRLFTGPSRTASILITVATTWFTANVLMAPWSLGMQQDIQQLLYIFH